MFIRIIDGYIVYYHPVLTGAWGVKCLGSLTSDVTGCKPKNECMSSDQKTPSLSSTCIHAWFSVRFVLLDHLKIIVCPLSFLFWPLHYLSFDLRLLVTHLVSSSFSESFCKQIPINNISKVHNVNNDLSPLDWFKLFVPLCVFSISYLTFNHSFHLQWKLGINFDECD